MRRLLFAAGAAFLGGLALAQAQYSPGIGSRPREGQALLQGHPGHIAAGFPAPALSSCGTSPAIVGDDKYGLVTMGTGSPTGCVITFAQPYIATPLCVVTWQATPLASQSWTVTTTAITTTQTGTSSNKLNYHCAAQNGG